MEEEKGMLYATQFSKCEVCHKDFKDINDRWRILQLHAIVEHAVCRSCYEKNQGKEWIPTPENINALPEPIRQYISDLETQSDPAGMVRENTLLKDQLKQMQKMIEELKKGSM